MLASRMYHSASPASKDFPLRFNLHVSVVQGDIRTGQFGVSEDLFS